MTLRDAVYSESPVFDDEVSNWTPGDVELAESLFGVPRFLWEMLIGAGIDGRSPMAPENPQGRIGFDVSGPPYGCALRHPMTVFGGAIVGAASDAYDQVGAGEQWLEVTSVKPLRVGGNLFRNRPHQPYPKAPYSRGYWLLFAARASGTGTVTLTITTRGSDGPTRSTTITTANDTPTRYGLDADGSAAAFYTPLRSGDTRAQLTIESDSADTVEITAVSMNQVAKRIHT